MRSRWLLLMLLVPALSGFAQQKNLRFKKGVRTIYSYWEGDFLAFQLADQSWRKGKLTRIQMDSVRIKPMVVHYYEMGTDTIYFPEQSYALTAIQAMPKKGFQIDYIRGEFGITRTGGHVHWFWVRNGLIFRIGAAGYAGLALANGIIENDYHYKATQFIVAGAVFLGGMILKYTFKPVWRVGRRHHFEVIDLSPPPPVSNG